MTSFHLPHLPPTYHQPACFRLLAHRLLRENCLQNAIRTTAVPTQDDHSFDWEKISANVLATVLGGLALAVVGAVGYIAWQVPRQQEMILHNQAQFKIQVTDLMSEIKRLEANDRVQDDRLIKLESRRD